MTFPATPLPVQTDIFVNGQWTGITASGVVGDGVRHDMGIEVDYGRPNEYGSLSANRSRFKLGNSQGDFSMRNPMGAYYGSLGQNTPLRHRIADTTLYPTPTIRSLTNATFSGAGGAITKPAGAAVGDVLYLFQSSDVVNESDEMADPTGVISTLSFPWILVGEEVTFSGPNLTTKVWRRRVTADEPSSYILYAQSGSDTVATMVCLQNASMADPSFNSFDQFAPGTTVDTAQTMPGGENDLELRWVAMADATGAANTWSPPVGFTEKSDLQSSTFTTGSLASRDLASKTSTGVHTFTGTSAVFDLGHGITVNIMADAVMYSGEVPRWPNAWDPTGTDVHVLVEAAGITQRLTQNAPPVLSQLRRGLAATPHLAYWPCEDGTGAIQLAAVDAGVRPGRFNFTGSPVSPGGAPDTLGGSAPLISMQTGAVVIFDVPSHSLAAFDGWTVQFLANVEYASAADAVLLQWSTPGGTPAIWQLEFNPSTDDLHIQGIDPSGAIVNTIDLACDFFGASSGESFFGEWVMITVTCSDSGGGNLTYQIAVQNGDGLNDQFTSSTDTGTIAPVKRVQVSPLSSELNGTGIGHMLVRALMFSDTNFMNDYTLMGQAKELAVDRLVRLCREEGIPLELHGSNFDAELQPLSSYMGPQGVDTAVNLIEECAKVDGGILVESRDFNGYVYRTRNSLANQTPAVELTYAAPTAHLGPEPLRPVDDDQLIKNSVTVKRRSGSSSATVQTLTGRMSINPPTHETDPGVGLYPDAPTLNLFYDSDADNHAGWRRHRGSIDEPRYPSVPVELARAVFVASSTLTKAVAALRAGDVLTISDMPSFWSTDDAECMVEGYRLRMGGQTWSYDFDTSPARAFRVFEMDDSELARVDTDGSTLNEALDTTETAIDVAIATGYPLWKTTDLTGLALDIGGEKMTVSAITGASSPQTFTVTRSVNGVVKEHDLGTPVHVWRPAVLSL